MEKPTNEKKKKKLKTDRTENNGEGSRERQRKITAQTMHIGVVRKSVKIAWFSINTKTYRRW